MSTEQSPKRLDRIKVFASRYPLGLTSVGLSAPTPFIDTKIALTAFGSSLLIATNEALFIRRHSKEISLVFGNKAEDTDRIFTVSPNPHAELVEKHLGLTFMPGLKPKKIEFTDVNKLTYKYKINGDLDKQLQDHTIGIYNSEYNAFFTTDPTSLLVDLHENIHAFTFQANPVFLYQIAETRNATKRVVWKRENPHPSFDIKKDYIFYIFNEGLSNFGTNVIMKDLIDQRIHEGQDHADLLHDLLRVLPNIPPHGNLARAFPPLPPYLIEKFQHFLEQRQQAFIVKGTRGKQKEIIARDNRELYIPVGNFFVQTTIASLMQLGMTRGEAFNTIIQKPPQTFDEITQPKQYVQNII